MYHLVELRIEKVKVRVDYSGATIAAFPKLPRIKRLLLCKLEGNRGSLERLAPALARVFPRVEHLSLDSQHTWLEVRGQCGELFPHLRPENVRLLSD